MNYRFLLILLFSLGSDALHATSKVIEIKSTGQCSYYGKILPDSLYTFKPDHKAERIIDKITAYTGLRRNFIIRAADVPNALAIMHAGKRYLLYNQLLINEVERKTHTYWAAISIMAHEIGHHLQGHTLDGEGSRPDRELEADEYSGFILQKMGATLTEAQAAINALGVEEGSSTHPPKKDRLSAIYTGWLKSSALNGVHQQSAKPTSATEKHTINRYEVNDGLVKDTKTGLMWTRCSIGQKWDDATCQGMATTYLWEQIITKHFNYAGYKDWRVPSVKELSTLLHCSNGEPKVWNNNNDSCAGSYANSAIINKAFPNTPTDTSFWSASQSKSNANNAWVVDFVDGAKHYDDKSNRFAVRLVRRM